METNTLFWSLSKSSQKNIFLEKSTGLGRYTSILRSFLTVSNSRTEFGTGSTASEPQHHPRRPAKPYNPSHFTKLRDFEYSTSS